jgi:hypothetical protein
MVRHVGVICLFAVGVSVQSLGQRSEVSIGAQAWAYDRVYPLLDGLFQDTASTQIAALTLNPNASNDSQVDALVQSLQIQAGYNQLSGVQNAAAAQMAVANLGYQSMMTQQQQSILQQQITAQQQLTQAQQTLSSVTQTGTTAQIAAATQAVTAAQTNVTGLAAEAALIKAPSSPYSPSAASGNIANALTTPTSTIPSAASGTGIQTGGPSFPATKQLDNQMDLLWSRLARVVGTMARPDSMKSDNRLFLIEFDTATFPGRNRKQELLETGYVLNCTDAGATPDAAPTVVDMFPRVAAVNIADTKYRDTSFNLGAVLAFFGFGINAGYNREHLKMSQTLGQSSYITGYGVGQAEFGWIFGIPLGDDIISSDTKRTFALISVPAKCKAPLIALKGTGWAKPKYSPTFPHDMPSQPVSFAAVTAMMNSSVAAAANQSVESLSFNRTSYNPATYTAANPALVTLEIRLTQPVDQQANVYANGTLLKRARDNFGRAIPGGDGSNGLLEEATSMSQVNTWIPVSSRSLLVNVDGGQFGTSFPTIQIVSPGTSQPFSISNSKPDGAQISVSGLPFECIKKTCQLPSVAYPLTTAAQVGVTRWAEDPAKPAEYSAVFTVTQSVTAIVNSPAPTGSAVQLVTGSTQNVWGPNAEVYVQFAGDQQNQQYRLTCDPTSSETSSGERLVCKIDTSRISGTKPEADGTHEAHFHIIDPGHVGGALEAWPALVACKDKACTPPTAWDITNPSWDDSASQWTFKVSFVNVKNLNHVTITPTPPNGVQQLTCDTSQVCSAIFKIKPSEIASWFDHMNLQYEGDSDDQWQILNVKSLIKPTVSVMSADFTSWTGANLTSVFNSASDPTKKTGLLIGSSTTPIPIACPVLSACTITDKTNLPATSGLMYLAASGIAQPIPLLQSNADGTTTPIMYQPAKAPVPVPVPAPAPPPAPAPVVMPAPAAANSALPAPSAAPAAAVPQVQTVLQGGPKQ